MASAHRALRRGLEPNLSEWPENSNRTVVVDERRRKVNFQAQFKPITAKKTYDRCDAC